MGDNHIAIPALLKIGRIGRTWHILKGPATGKGRDFVW